MSDVIIDITQYAVSRDCGAINVAWLLNSLTLQEEP